MKCSPDVLQMLQFWQMMIRPLAVKVPINIILHMHQQQKLIRSISKQICMICMHSYHHLLRLQSFSLRAQAHKKVKIRRRRRGTVLWMVFYADISWESRCCSEIKVWGNLCQIFVVFEVPARPLVKGMSGNS